MDLNLTRYEASLELYNLLRVICFSRCIRVSNGNKFCIVIDAQTRAESIQAVATSAAPLMDWADELGLNFNQPQTDGGE